MNAVAESTVGSYEYLAVLGLCLLVTLPLELVLGVRVYRQPLRLALSVACVAGVFVAWDVLGAWLGHWDFEPTRTTGVFLLGLPLEEYAFFVVVPVCALLTFEAVRATLPDVSRWLRRRLGAGRTGGPPEATR